ncbi:MAG: ABC-2 transporter permease [Roseburia sp.]|nr:ABC-2 transporter permease [Roseburia sp.]
MRGLLIKDFKMLLIQKMFLLITAGVMVALFFTNEGMLIGYVVSYMTVMGAVLVVSSLSYDEMDNCMAFLVTLPTGRVSYVRSKYLFGLAVMLGMWGITLVLGCLFQRILWRNGDVTEILLTSSAMLVVGALIIAVMIPVALIFGTAKCRLVILMMVAVVYGVVFLATTKLEALRNIPLEEIFSAFFGQGTAALFWECFLAMLALLGVSYAVSARHMKRKQF